MIEVAAKAGRRPVGARMGGFLHVAEVEAFGRLLRDSPLEARRIATVCAGAATRMQARRVTGRRPGTAVFEPVAAAEAWLAAR